MAAGSVYDVLTEFPGMERRQGRRRAVAGHAVVAGGARRPRRAARRHQCGKGLRLTAAEGPDQALKQMLIRAGIEPGRDLEIVELPGARGRDVSFGVFAARALEEGQIDGFWANAMGAETAVSRGAGKILIDVRRGDDPGDVRHFTFAAVATTDRYLEQNAASVEAAVRAIVKAQSMLRADPSLAREVGQGKFPPEAAELIATHRSNATSRSTIRSSPKRRSSA